MDSEDLITSLPIEVLVQILENVETTDVMHFALTCKQMYYSITTTKYFWKRRFLKSWPDLEHKTVHIKDFDWMEETKLRIQCGKAVFKKMAQISSKEYKKENMDVWDVKEFDCLFLPEFGARTMDYHYLLDALNDFFRYELENPNEELLHNAERVVTYVTRKYLFREWRKFMVLPVENQIREWLVSFFSQWCMTKWGETYESTAWKIDKIADKVRALVAEKHPNNPLNFVSRENINRWKTENLSENAWPDEDSKPIWDIVYQVVSKHIARDYPFNLPWWHGDRLTQGILLESVARRVGIKCEILYGGYDEAFDRERWILKYNNTRAVVTKFFSPLDETDVQEKLDSEDIIAVAIHRLTYKCGIPEWIILEFKHMRAPDQLGTIHRLINACMQGNMCVTRYMEKLENILEDETKDPAIFKQLSRRETALLIERCKIFESRRREAEIAESGNPDFLRHGLPLSPVLNPNVFDKMLEYQNYDDLKQDIL